MERYIQSIQDGDWADNPTIFALSQSLDVNFQIIGSNGSIINIGEHCTHPIMLMFGHIIIAGTAPHYVSLQPIAVGEENLEALLQPSTPEEEGVQDSLLQQVGINCFNPCVVL